MWVARSSRNGSDARVLGVASKLATYGEPQTPAVSS